MNCVAAIFKDGDFLNPLLVAAIVAFFVIMLFENGHQFLNGIGRIGVRPIAIFVIRPPKFCLIAYNKGETVVYAICV